MATEVLPACAPPADTSPPGTCRDCNNPATDRTRPPTRQSVSGEQQSIVEQQTRTELWKVFNEKGTSTNCVRHFMTFFIFFQMK